MGIEATFTLLAENGSPAALEAVVEALAEPYAPIQARAVSVLLSHEVRRGLARIIEHFHSFDTKTQSRVEQEIQLLMPMLRDILAGGAEQSRLNVIDIVKRSRELEPLRLAVRALEDPSATVRDCATTVLVEEAERLGRGTARLRGSVELASREAVEERRQKLASLLSDAFETYATHKERRLLNALLDLGAEAMLVVVTRLLQPNHPAGEDFVAMLRNSSSVSVLDMLMRLAQDRNERARRLGEEVLTSRTGRMFTRAVADWVLSLDEHELAARASHCSRLPWLPALLEHLWDLEPRTHLRTLRFIEHSRMSEPEKAPWLAKFLLSSNPEVRLQAVNLLAKTGAASAIEGIARALTDQEESVVKAALEAVISLNPPDKVKLLAPLLGSQFDSVRRRVSRELSRDNFERYRVAFDKLDPKTRELAGRAIAKIDPEMAERLADELKSLDVDRRVKALRITEVAAKERELEPILLELLNDPSRKVRATVVRTIGLLGNIDAIRALIKALSDPDRRTRANAIEAFEELGNPKLGALILPFLADPDNRIRANAAKALWNLGHPETKQVLDEMLDDASELMRLSAIWAMGEINYPGVKQVLAEVAEKDTSKTVRQKAADILAKLAQER